MLTYANKYWAILNKLLKITEQKDTTVELDFKNQLCFKKQITNDQLDQNSFKIRQDKNNLTLRTKMAVTKNILKVKLTVQLFNNPN